MPRSLAAVLVSGALLTGAVAMAPAASAATKPAGHLRTTVTSTTDGHLRVSVTASVDGHLRTNVAASTAGHLR